MGGKYASYYCYKYSGLKFIGDVPKNWLVTRLKYEAQINMGQSPSSDDCNKEGIGLPFLQGNAEFGREKPSPINFCEIPRKVAHKGDVLFSVRAPVGASNKADQSYGIGRGLCAISCREKLLKEFLWWMIPILKLDLDSVATGSTFEAVSAEQVENVAIFSPSLIEQQKIADFLSHETAKIDTLIEKQQQLIKLLKEKRQTVISHAVTKGLNPDAPMKDSGVEWLGEVPAEWSSTKMKFCVRTAKGIAFKASEFADSGVPVVKASDIKNLTIQNSDSFFLPSTYLEQYPEAILKSGDIVLSTVGSIPRVKNSAVGQLAVVPKSHRGRLLNQNTVIFKISASQIEKKFFTYCLLTHAYRDHLDVHAHGTANQASLSLVDMLDFEVPVPSIEEQVAIVDSLDGKIENFILLEQNATSIVELLKERRTALISAAVTGKIDVRNWQAPESTSTPSMDA